MSNKKGKTVSVQYIKKEFTTVGLVFCLYILLVLYAPSILNIYFNINPNFASVLSNKNIFIGLIYMLFVIGTIVPSLMLIRSTKIKVTEVWRDSTIKFKDIFISTIVFIALGTASMFLTFVLSSYLPFSEDIVSPIGLSIQKEYLSNILYVFLFIVVSPILEEFVFRGLLSRVLGRYGNRFAIYAIALFYALSHISFSEMIPAFVMSVFLTKITLRYRSVQPTIIIHILYNIFLYVFACVPPQYYLVMATSLFLLYFLAIIFVLTKKYRYIRIKKQQQQDLVWSIFLTRPSVIFALFLVVFHSFLMSII